LVRFRDNCISDIIIGSEAKINCSIRLVGYFPPRKEYSLFLSVRKYKKGEEKIELKGSMKSYFSGLMKTRARLYLFIYATLTPLTKIISNVELQTARRAIEKIRLLSFVAKPLLRYQQKILRISTNK